VGPLGINPALPRFEPPVPTSHDRDSMGVKWVAHDDNDDQLTYSLYYRGDGETRWLLLKDGLTDKFYSFDASLLPTAATPSRSSPPTLLHIHPAKLSRPRRRVCGSRSTPLRRASKILPPRLRATRFM